MLSCGESLPFLSRQRLKPDLPALEASDQLPEHSMREIGWLHSERRLRLWPAMQDDAVLDCHIWRSVVSRYRPHHFRVSDAAGQDCKNMQVEMLSEILIFVMCHRSRPLLTEFGIDQINEQRTRRFDVLADGRS